MDRNVRMKVNDTRKEKVENVSTRKKVWTELPKDMVFEFFLRLNNRDRASLSSTCKSWWSLSKFPFLWQTLDLRFKNIDADEAASLASRCGNLQKLCVRGNESASYVVNLKASNLTEISIDNCTHVTDAALSELLVQHNALECIQIGPVFHLRISSDSIKAIALCCPNLKKLWLTGIHNVTGEHGSCLETTAASMSAPLEAKAFAWLVLRNLEHHHVDHSK